MYPPLASMMTRFVGARVSLGIQQVQDQIVQFYASMPAHEASILGFIAAAWLRIDTESKICLNLQVMFAPVAVACYASLVSHRIIPSVAFTSKHGEMSPQLEVLLASLFTVSSWRGIYAGLRPFM